VKRAWDRGGTTSLHPSLNRLVLAWDLESHSIESRRADGPAPDSDRLVLLLQASNTRGSVSPSGEPGRGGNLIVDSAPYQITSASGYLTVNYITGALAQPRTAASLFICTPRLL
jgi:hypothetical protein